MPAEDKLRKLESGPRLSQGAGVKKERCSCAPCCWRLNGMKWFGLCEDFLVDDIDCGVRT